MASLQTGNTAAHIPPNILPCLVYDNTCVHVIKYSTPTDNACCHTCTAIDLQSCPSCKEPADPFANLLCCVCFAGGLHIWLVFPASLMYAWLAATGSSCIRSHESHLAKLTSGNGLTMPNLQVSASSGLAHSRRCCCAHAAQQKQISDSRYVTAV